MPKLWTETIDAHRHAVRDAILDATSALVAERGPLSVTMSQIAETTGIGRATLYKYFPDVEAILVAWHQRHVADHLKHLAGLRDKHRDANGRLEAVLAAYARISHHRGRHDGEITALVHRAEHVAGVEQQLVDLFGQLLADAAREGYIRDDAGPEELARFCVHALTAASGLPSEEAVGRLVEITLAGLRPPR